MKNMISVIVPIYNAEKHLARCIESIRRQTYSNIEIILINDGSTDRSLEICEQFSVIDSRIILIDKVNEGVSATRNKGITVAKGEYIGFVDSDDYIEENMYEILIKRIQEDDSQLSALTNYTINDFKNNSEFDRNGTINGVEALKYLFYLSFPTSLWAYLYTRDVLRGVILNDKVHYFEDFEFNALVLKNSKKVSLCNEMLYNYNINDESINAQDINDKKITCLRIYDNLSKIVLPNNVIKHMSFFRAYFYINVFVNLYNSRKIDEKYFKLLAREARKLLLSSIASINVPVKYKAVIFTCAINVRFACELYSMFHRN